MRRMTPGFRSVLSSGYARNMALAKLPPAREPAAPAPTEGLATPTDTPWGMPNCGVVAVSVAAKVPYAEAVKAFGRKRGNWKGRTRRPERARALKALRVGWIDIDLPYPPRKRRVTLATWVRRFSVPGRTYMIDTTGHTQVVRDGQVCDQRGATDIDEYWGRRKFVNCVWEILD